MKQVQAEPVRPTRADTRAPHGLELRHLRYLVAVADAGTFTRAAERLFIAQPTLSQQIGRLEQAVGTPLLHRGRDGVRLTAAGAVLLDAARDVLAAVDHGVSNAVSSKPPIRSSRSERPVRARTPPPKRCRPRASSDIRAKPTQTTARTMKIPAFALPRISTKPTTKTAARANNPRTSGATSAGFGSSHGGGLEDIERTH